ncbi:M48 family metallopeptidase [Solimonas sp. SE-A11]|uniref:M48 family metallopeptidase n=1 Tax=Solimonas sp. SE-A11 TaxID=3054954 RepID=UPI00259CC10A|nr:M48 family metallopeptidase [Solimonas sp. SE-A11]MDM4769356.1 M48 family metallopeptidase [Solimonas sp. SE-A11]
MPSPSRYAAHAFHDSLPDGRSSGELLVTPLGFQFRCATGAVDLPFRGAELRLGGASDRLVFISNPARLGWSVYTDDRSLIADPLLAQQPELQPALSSMRRKRTGGWLATLAIALLLLGLPLAFLFNIDIFAGMAAKRIPPEWEEGLGKRVFAQYEIGAQLVEDKALAAQLKKLTDPLEQQIEKPRYPFRFHIAKDSQINAFALPGGYVVINSELILRARTADELLGVVAHEMSHVTEQHGMRSVITSAGVLLIAQALLGDVAGLAATLASAAPLLLNQSYSRGFEKQADKRGVELLQRAGIDPLGMVRFFELVQSEEKKRQEKIRKTAGDRTADVLEGASKFLSTHPQTQDRIEAIRKMAAKQPGPYVNLDADFQRLQEQVRAIVAQDNKDEEEGTEDENRN